MTLKGLKVVRREACDFVKAVCKDVLHQMLEKRDVTAAKVACHTAILQLLKGEVPMNQLTVSARLGTDYAPDRTPPAHVYVAQQMEKRMPGSSPRTGELV